MEAQGLGVEAVGEPRGATGRAPAVITRARGNVCIALAAAALPRIAGFCVARRREYQPPTWNSTVMAIRAAPENHTMLCWPRGTTMKAASSGPAAEPMLPPTWNSDCARP